MAMIFVFERKGVFELDVAWPACLRALLVAGIQPKANSVTQRQIVPE